MNKKKVDLILINRIEGKIYHASHKYTLVNTTKYDTDNGKIGINEKNEQDFVILNYAKDLYAKLKDYAYNISITKLKMLRIAESHELLNEKN